MLRFVAGVIPVMEEFVFRGVMPRTTARYCALWIAVIGATRALESIR